MDHHALQNGHMLFEYRIEKLLGEGGFGLTYLAFDTHLDKNVAVKEYYPADFAFRKDGNTVVAKSQSTTTDYEWGLRAFLSEAKTLARYSDPHIIQIYRFFEANGTAYMVMEYCDGGNLKDRIDAQSVLKEESVRDMLIPIMNGLQLVHDNGVLHRDIKPENIMFRGDGAPVLIDFGAARQAIGAKSRSVTTIVSPGYAPIEQYSSKAVVGPSSDIYSLAAVGYFCLTGNKPEDATDRIVVDSQGKLGAKVGASQFLKSLDEAMSVHAEQRPQTLIDWYEQWEQDDAGTAPSNRGTESKLIRNAATVKVDKITDAGDASGNTSNKKGTQGRSALPLIAVLILFVFAGGGYFAYDYLESDPSNLDEQLVSGPGNPRLDSGESTETEQNQELQGETQEQASDLDTSARQESEAAHQQLVRNVQQELSRLGYSVGVPDGIAGSQTAGAIESFQSGMGLSVSGNVSEALLAELRATDQRPAVKTADLDDDFSGYISITNDTGYDIYYLYVSHDDADNWGEDVLGEDTLSDGDNFRVDLHDHPSSLFDVRAKDEDDDTYTFYRIDVATQDLTITLDDLDDESDSGDSFSGYIEVTNNTGYDIYYLYVSHEDSENWEEDVLGDDVLSNGESVRTTLNDYPSSIFDIRAEDEDEDTYTIYGINVASEDLTLTLDNLD